MRIKRKQQEEPEELDFDFSLYEKERVDDDDVTTTKAFERPPVTLYKARWSQGQQMQEMMAYTHGQVAKYSARVYALSNTLQDYADLYGYTVELWSQFREIHGKVINDVMDSVEAKAFDLLRKAGNDKKYFDELREVLLEFKQKVYLLKQKTGLGIEVDRIGTNTRSSAIQSLSE